MSSMAAIAERAAAVIKKIEKGELSANDRVRRLIRIVAAVARHEEAYGALSSREKLAVALVLDRHDLLIGEQCTMLQALKRLEPEWLEAAQTVEQMVRG
jgi:hypothetical protein